MDIFVPDNSSFNPTLEDGKNYLEELVGEDKKFKLPEELAKGKYVSDQFIEWQKSKIAKLEQELNTRTSFDVLKTELEEIKHRSANPPVHESPPAPTDPNKVDASDLKAAVDKLFAEREQATRAESNLERVGRVMADNFGPEAKSVLQSKAQELGMSLADLQQIAVRSPDALFRIVGANPSASRMTSTPSLPNSTVRLDTPGTVNGASRGASYYQKLRAQDPKRYASSEVEKEMMINLQRLGRDTFYAS